MAKGFFFEAIVDRVNDEINVDLRSEGNDEINDENCYVIAVEIGSIELRESHNDENDVEDEANNAK